MDDLISRAAAIAAMTSRMDVDALKALPAVDDAPVVRCKDCKHAHMTYGGECKYCDVISMLDDEGDSVAMYLPGDWFCADGERRDDE